MMVLLVGLAIFSGLSLNLLLQFALGTAGAAGDSSDTVNSGIPFIQFCFLFVSVLFLWTFFSYVLPVFWRGFSEVFLFFPFSALVCMGLEFLVENLFPKLLPKLSSNFKGIKKTFTAFTAYDGLVPASLMITFAVAGNFANAMVLALFFAFGNMLAMIILNEIRLRSNLEWVPRYLRGSPLIFISMGLLSLIAISVAGIFFKALELF